MPIVTAVERGSSIHVYGPNGAIIATLSRGDGLHGYTSGSISVRRGSSIVTYDDKQRMISVVACPKSR